MHLSSQRVRLARIVQKGPKNSLSQKEKEAWRALLLVPTKEQVDEKGTKVDKWTGAGAAMAR